MNGSREFKTFSIKKLSISLSLVVVAFMMVIHTASALARGYATDDPELRTGMTASLSDSSTPDSPKAERASISDDNAIIGIAAALGSDLATVVSSEDQVYIQSDGEANAYVSDINGDVESGDPLTLSPLKGILMRADETTTQPIIGVALQPFDDGSIENRTIEKDGKEQESKLSLMRVSLDHRAFVGNDTRLQNSSIDKIGKALTGREVAEIRVLAALIIFIIVLVAEGGIIYGAVTSSITALGRNPLARKIIVKEVGKIVLLAIIVLALGVSTIYALLWV